MIRVIFHHSDKPREVQLAQAFQRGVERLGDSCALVPLGAPAPSGEYDLACMVGVKAAALWTAAPRWARHRLMIDKGYSRHKIGGFWEYWRLSLDAHHPTHTTLRTHAYPNDRFKKLRWTVGRYIQKRHAIVIAGSSEKYHRFYGLPHPTEYARSIVEQLRDLTEQEIVYRPKPSWRDARPIKGSVYSPAKEDFHDLLGRASCLVTHGSNACVDAMVAGVPAVTLGDGVAAAIGGTSLLEARDPPRPDRSQWLANLAYHQWTESELASGMGWQVVKGWIYGV